MGFRPIRQRFRDINLQAVGKLSYLALILGLGIRVRSLPEEKLPRSESVRFAQGWSAVRLTQEKLDVITSRMTSVT